MMALKQLDYHLRLLQLPPRNLGVLKLLVTIRELSVQELKQVLCNMVGPSRPVAAATWLSRKMRVIYAAAQRWGGYGSAGKHCRMSTLQASDSQDDFDNCVSIQSLAAVLGGWGLRVWSSGCTSNRRIARA
ncbi:hypothetical protein N9L68_05975 [bacterium]|nr:hypothetical protein [bacterium]